MKKYTPSDLLYYFAGEKKVLLYVTISGLIYNVGMTLSPWFEGQLAQYVIDILGGERAPSAMLRLASLYLLTIMIVQGCRALKRLYVRHFANDISLAMKAILYRTLIHQETAKAGETGPKTSSGRRAGARTAPSPKCSTRLDQRPSRGAHRSV